MYKNKKLIIIILLTICIFSVKGNDINSVKYAVLNEYHPANVAYTLDLYVGVFSTDGGDKIARSLLDFDVSAYENKKIGSAILTLNAEIGDQGTNTYPQILEIYKVLEEWDDVTWNTQPQYDTTLQATVEVTDSGDYNLDITDLVQSWVIDLNSNFGILLKAQDETTLNFKKFGLPVVLSITEEGDLTECVLNGGECKTSCEEGEEEKSYSCDTGKCCFIIGKPDLIISDATFNDVGDNYYDLFAVIKNIGLGFSDGYSFKAHINDDPIEFISGTTNEQLSPEEQKQIVLGTRQLTTYDVITVIVDPDNEIEEENEDNNELKAKFSRCPDGSVTACTSPADTDEWDCGDCVVEIGCTTPTDDMIITEDTTFCPGTYNLPNGITIGADNVVLDCDRAVLDGDVNTENYGILLDEINNVEIKNCEIREYKYGIFMHSSSNIHLLDNNFFGTSVHGIYMERNSHNNLIYNNNIHNYAGVAIFLRHSPYNNISNNFIENSSFGGYYAGIAISLDFSGHNIIESNIIRNHSNGIFLLYSSNNTILYNTIENNRNVGVYFQSSSENFMLDNEVNFNIVGSLLGSTGTPSFSNTISNNIFKDNKNHAIIVNSYSHEEDGSVEIEAYNNSIWNNDIYTSGIDDDNPSQNIYCVDGIGNNYYNGADGPKCPETLCTDSDGGKNYYVRGVIAYEGRRSAAIDSCSNANTLSEGYCENNEVKWETHVCPNGCKDGACTAPECEAIGSLNEGESSTYTVGAWDYYVEATNIAEAVILTVNGEITDSLDEEGSYILANGKIIKVLKIFSDSVTFCFLKGCIDSDGWKNYYEKGTVHGLEAPGVWSEWTDYCGLAGDEEGMVVEYVCMPDNYGEKVLYNCPNGCEDGACIQDNQVRFDLAVMSKCPYGTKVENTMNNLIDQFRSYLDFNLDLLSYIRNGEIYSLHGESETEGNKIQICAKKYEPSGYMDMIVCMNQDLRNIPDDWESCADEYGLDVNAIKACAYGDEGEELLWDSAERLAAQGISGSPTMHINGVQYDGLRDEDSLKKAICDAFGTNKPSICDGLTVDCTDSDGGKNYYVKGILQGTLSGGASTTVEDYCNDGVDLGKKLATGSHVSEYYCHGGSIHFGREITLCPQGCKDGACISPTVNVPIYEIGTYWKSEIHHQYYYTSTQPYNPDEEATYQKPEPERREYVNRHEIYIESKTNYEGQKVYEIIYTDEDYSSRERVKFYVTKDHLRILDVITEEGTVDWSIDLLNFPLYVGKKWSSTWKFQEFPDQSVEEYDVSFEVVGVEEYDYIINEDLPVEKQVFKIKATNDMFREPKYYHYVPAYGDFPGSSILDVYVEFESGYSRTVEPKLREYGIKKLCSFCGAGLFNICDEKECNSLDNCLYKGKCIDVPYNLREELRFKIEQVLNEEPLFDYLGQGSKIRLLVKINDKTTYAYNIEKYDLSYEEVVEEMEVEVIEEGEAIELEETNESLFEKMGILEEVEEEEVPAIEPVYPRKIRVSNYYRDPWSSLDTEDVVISYLHYTSLIEMLKNPSCKIFKNGANGKDFFLLPSKFVKEGFNIQCDKEFTEKYCNFVSSCSSKGDIQEVGCCLYARLTCYDVYTKVDFGVCNKNPFECKEGYTNTKCEDRKVFGVNVQRNYCESIYETECSENYECKKPYKIIAVESCDEEIECTDSDVTEEYPDGKNYYVKGTSSDYGTPTPIEDMCINNNELLEYSCTGNDTEGIIVLEKETYYCPNGCEDGACVSILNLIAYYPFESNLNDHSGNNHHANMKNPEFVSSKLGNGLRLDGNSASSHDWFSLNHYPEGTVTAWFYPEKDPDPTISGYIVTIRDGTRDPDNTRIYLKHRGSRMVWTVGDTAIGLDNSIQLGRWYHAALTWDGERFNAYLDGNKIEEKEYSESEGSGDEYFWIGSYKSGEYFRGIVDDVRVYDKALSDEEVMDLYGG